MRARPPPSVILTAVSAFQRRASAHFLRRPRTGKIATSVITRAYADKAAQRNGSVRPCDAQLWGPMCAFASCFDMLPKGFHRRESRCRRHRINHVEERDDENMRNSWRSRNSVNATQARRPRCFQQRDRRSAIDISRSQHSCVADEGRLPASGKSHDPEVTEYQNANESLAIRGAWLSCH